jgi:hypothetical protein
MPEFPILMCAVAAMLAGGAAASGWTSSVIVANTAFDGLDHGRADRMLRKVLVATAGFQTILLGAAAACALLGQAFAAGIVAAIAAVGFFSNVWTLAPRKDKAPDGLKKRNKTMRVVAVALTLMVTLVAVGAAVMAALGI